MKMVYKHKTVVSIRRTDAMAAIDDAMEEAFRFVDDNLQDVSDVAFSHSLTWVVDSEIPSVYRASVVITWQIPEPIIERPK